MTSILYPPPLGHRRTKLYWCDNCGRRHWGHYEKVGGWEFTEYDFIWTTPQGVRKQGAPC